MSTVFETKPLPLKEFISSYLEIIFSTQPSPQAIQMCLDGFEITRQIVSSSNQEHDLMKLIETNFLALELLHANFKFTLQFLNQILVVASMLEEFVPSEQVRGSVRLMVSKRNLAGLYEMLFVDALPTQ